METKHKVSSRNTECFGSYEPVKWKYSAGNNSLTTSFRASGTWGLKFIFELSSNPQFHPKLNFVNQSKISLAQCLTNTIKYSIEPEALLKKTVPQTLSWKMTI